jgi:hypothetical protein
MGRCPKRCAAVLLSVAIGCGDGAPPDGGAVACAGDRWVENAERLGAIVGCTTITGNVSVTGEVTSFELPLLTRIDGFLTVWSNSLLTRASLPKLEVVGGYLEVSYNAALTSLDLPALRSINERAVPAANDVVIRDNALTTCQTDAIRDRLFANGVRGRVSISGNGGPCAR